MESFVKLEDVEKIYPNGAKAVYKFFTADAAG